MKKYTLEEIKVIWKEYQSKKVLQVLQKGKWRSKELTGQGIPRINGAKARIVDLKSIMSFPIYLEKDGRL